MNDQSNRGDRLIKIVRSYAKAYEDICKLAQDKKLVAADFDPIANMLATDVFTRIGVFKDFADWPLCLEKYLQFAGTSLWTDKMRYIHTVGNMVFQELEETIIRPHGTNVIYTMSVYEFNDDDKITALRVYMQQPQDVQNVLIMGTDKK